jgi:dienelactone hydrolase
MMRQMVMTKLMLKSARNPTLTTPASVGLAFENVSFKATDGVEIRGWFIPAKGAVDGVPRPVVLFVHGWMWNRLGNVSGKVPFVDRDVDFLPATRALHDKGYHVLLIDVSNHGESGSRLPVTYGPWEARDFCGAVNYLRARPDVDGNRIGALGCSMGGNIAIYGTPDCQPVKAILAVQPAVLPHFNHNFALKELGFGKLGPALVGSADILWFLMRAPLLSRHNPAIPARKLGKTVVQYVQGTGDPWGTMEDVEAMAAATPNALPVVRFPSVGRYEGYQYVSKEVGQVTDFFVKHL